MLQFAAKYGECGKVGSLFCQLNKIVSGFQVFQVRHQSSSITDRKMQGI